MPLPFHYEFMWRLLHAIAGARLISCVICCSDTFDNKWLEVFGVKLGVGSGRNIFSSHVRIAVIMHWFNLPHKTLSREPRKSHVLKMMGKHQKLFSEYFGDKLISFPFSASHILWGCGISDISKHIIVWIITLFIGNVYTLFHSIIFNTASLLHCLCAPKRLKRHTVLAQIYAHVLQS